MKKISYFLLFLIVPTLTFAANKDSSDIVSIPQPYEDLQLLVEDSAQVHSDPISQLSGLEEDNAMEVDTAKYFGGMVSLFKYKEVVKASEGLVIKEKDKVAWFIILMIPAVIINIISDSLRKRNFLSTHLSYLSFILGALSYFSLTSLMLSSTKEVSVVLALGLLCIIIGTAMRFLPIFDQIPKNDLISNELFYSSVGIFIAVILLV
jgi:hypothetical protein